MPETNERGRLARAEQQLRWLKIAVVLLALGFLALVLPPTRTLLFGVGGAMMGVLLIGGILLGMFGLIIGVGKLLDRLFPGRSQERSDRTV